MNQPYIDVPLTVRIFVVPTETSKNEYVVTPPHMRGVTTTNAATDMLTGKPTETIPSEPVAAAKVTTAKVEAK